MILFPGGQKEKELLVKQIDEWTKGLALTPVLRRVNASVSHLERGLGMVCADMMVGGWTLPFLNIFCQDLLMAGKRFEATQKREKVVKWRKMNLENLDLHYSMKSVFAVTLFWLVTLQFWRSRCTSRIDSFLLESAEEFT